MGVLLVREKVCIAGLGHRHPLLWTGTRQLQVGGNMSSQKCEHRDALDRHYRSGWYAYKFCPECGHEFKVQPKLNIITNQE